MLIVGLTGGIASGKSTVSRLLSQKHNLPLIDLDILARQVVSPSDSSGTLRALVSHFGREILQEDGTLNRPALGRLCFGNEPNRKVLNTITHTAIRKRMAWMLFWNWITGCKVTIVDTPLLVEAGLWAWCGLAVVVWWYVEWVRVREMVLNADEQSNAHTHTSSPEDQLSRMLVRDSSNGLTEDDARSRLASQWELRKKLPYADVVLDNSSALSGSGSSSGGASEVLDAQVTDMVRSWRRTYSGMTGTLYWLATWLVPPFGLLMGLLCVWERRQRVQRRLREAEESDAQAVHRRSVGSL